MMRIVFSVLFFASLFIFPWYVTVLLGGVLVVLWEAYFEVVLVGLLLDILFGAPVAALNDFSLIYATFFIFLSLSSFFLRRVILD